MKKILLIILGITLITACGNSEISKGMTLETNEEEVNALVNDNISEADVKKIEEEMNYNEILITENDVNDKNYRISVNDKFGLTLPSDIKRMTNEELTERYGEVKPPVAYSDFKGIDISIAYDPTPIYESNMAEMLDFFESAYVQSYGEYFKLISKEVKEINGSQLGILEFTMEQEGENLYMKTVMGLIDKTFLSIAFSCQVNTQSEHEVIFNKIIDTIEVIK